MRFWCYSPENLRAYMRESYKGVNFEPAINYNFCGNEKTNIHQQKYRVTEENKIFLMLQIFIYLEFCMDKPF